MIQLEVISDNIIVELNGQTTDVIIELQPLMPATGGGGATNLNYIASPLNGRVTSDTGTDAIIPLAGGTNAGLLSASEKLLISTALQSVQAGTNVTIDNTNPLSPIINATGGGSGGAVDSVFGRIGAVSALSGDYNTDKVTETLTKVFVTPTEKTAITHSNRSVLDAITESFTTALKTAYDNTTTWVSTNSSALLSHLTNTLNPHSTTATQVDALQRNGSNANSDIDLGTFALDARFIKIKGTTGHGFLGLKHQSTNATAGGQETSLFAGTDGELYYKNDGTPLQQVAARTWVTSLGYWVSTAATSLVAGITKLYTSTGSNTDGTMTQLAVTDALANKVDKTNWIDISATSTIVGFSVFTAKQIWYQKINEKLIIVKASLSGTSNSGLLNFTIPFTSANNGTNNVTSAGVVNNSSSQAQPAFATCNPNTSVVNIYRDFNAQAFTASGNKTGQTTIAIEIQ